MEQRAVRRIGYARALVRYFRDDQASFFGKLFVVLSVVYVVMPIDAIPDFAPVVGWLDDLGVATVAFAFLARVLGKYRADDSTASLNADAAWTAAPAVVRAPRR
jgi:uncharacterized membrane protein YkvA (DUF1232 family)